MAHVREFNTGATRDTTEGKPDYEGYLSPLAITCFGRYMLKHQDKGKRASDNWQLGIPKEAYMKSAWRHFLDIWLFHRGWIPKSQQAKSQQAYAHQAYLDSLCGVWFNIQGLIHEEEKDHRSRVLRVERGKRTTWTRGRPGGGRGHAPRPLWLSDQLETLHWRVQALKHYRFKVPKTRESKINP